MTDAATELPTPEVHICPAERLQIDLEQAEQQLRNLRSQMGAIRQDIEEAVANLDTDEGDGGFAEELVEFLNSCTPWEFSLEREYRVKIIGWVTVEARSAEAAEELVNREGDWSWRNSQASIEPEGFETDGAELT